LSNNIGQNRRLFYLYPPFVGSVSYYYFEVLFSIMTKSSTSLLPVSKTCKFRVAINSPEKWKVQSIAQFKKIQTAKIAKVTAAKAKLQERGFVAKEGPTASHKNHIPIDHIKKELEILHNNSLVIRNKMMALSSVRTSLLWLLKKSNMVERSIIG
jgi:hypothetical protein